MRILNLILIAGLTVGFCANLDAQRKRGKRGGGAIIAKLDTDKDGKISKAEAKGTRLERAFDKIDANSDGFITQAELAAARKGRKGKRRRGKRGRGKRGGK